MSADAYLWLQQKHGAPFGRVAEALFAVSSEPSLRLEGAATSSSSGGSLPRVVALFNGRMSVRRISSEWKLDTMLKDNANVASRSTYVGRSAIASRRLVSKRSTSVS